MSNDRVIEIKMEDKKSFKGFVVILIVAMLVGGLVGFTTEYFEDIFKNNIPSLVRNIFVTITPFANLVMSVVILIAYTIVYNKCRKEYELWKVTEEDEDIINNIEKRLSYIMLFSVVNLILVLFFGGLAGMLLPFDNASGGLSKIKAFCFLGGVLLAIISTFRIQKNVVNFEKEINPLLKGSVYDIKFSEKWIDSCDEAIKLGIYKSAFKAYSAVTISCIVLWIICILGYELWDFGVMPMVIVIVIWLVQTITYCFESMKY